MKIKELSIPGLVVFKPQVYKDDRGFFTETFNEKIYEEVIGKQTFVQDNHSFSTQGVLRGMHFQVNNPQGKLVRCTRGEVFDVAVDLRKDSSTFGQWEGVVLSGRNNTQFWIPPGFAHGFVVTSYEANFEYKCTNYYDPTSEHSLLWNDPDIDIDWGFDMIFNESFQPVVSPKDSLAKTFKELEATVL